ncbi:F-box domain-containing protein [Mycena chlorophos]|uniref:F-box domain-containing protein n=1 Tax=Mycena chlorophos TaxID=658473 RepID=A0A8H6WHL4_MYCCL|nr:F-box domain-containing protein [Mycena chlorophos]
MLHPIHMLPPEILAHVFVLLCRDAGTDTAQARTRTLLLLARVCGLWRDVALRTPALWSVFSAQVFPGRFAEKSIAKLDAMLSWWLAHSRAHPLNLRLHHPHRLPECTAGHDANVVRLLVESMSHWADVDLFLHASTLSLITSTLLFARNGNKQDILYLPHLRCVSLACLPIRGQQPSQIRLFANAEVPNLTTATLIKIAPSPARIVLPWHQLRLLRVQCDDVRASLGVLRLAPELEELNVEITGLGDGVDPEDGSMPAEFDNELDEAHTALRSLSIDMHPAAALANPLRDILGRALIPPLPALRNLVLPALTPSDVPAFSVLVTTRAPNVQRLEIALAALPHGFLHRAFLGAKNLKELQTRYAGQEGLRKLLYRLATGDRAQPKFLPSLESLHIESFPGHASPSTLPPEALLAVLRARGPKFNLSMSSGGGDGEHFIVLDPTPTVSSAGRSEISEWLEDMAREDL